MKNLKKISRSEMKTMIGGGGRTPDPLVEPGRWCCCNGGGQCSSGVYGDSNDLVCVDAGTSLQKC